MHMSDSTSMKTITEDGQLLLRKAERDQVETVWDRFAAQQPSCGYTLNG
jgi:carbon-monoxide dehydrogenase catalytic subunit